MKYHVLIDGNHHEVVVERHDAGLAVTLGDETHQFDVGVLADGRAYSLLIDDRSVDVSVEEHGDVLELLIGGRRYAAETLGEREWLARAIKQEGGAGDKLVRAVMTGIVRDVLVQPGDAVAAGQILVILEAMKMENEVRAEVAGTVTKVAAAAGATVDKGDLLVEID